MMPPPMMTISAWVGSWGAMRFLFVPGWRWRPLCYGVPAGTMAGGVENERCTPCPAEKAASGAAPARRRRARGLSGANEHGGWSPCPAVEGFTTECTEVTEEGCLRSVRAGLDETA